MMIGTRQLICLQNHHEIQEIWPRNSTSTFYENWIGSQ
jgi:hypothetical protein